MPRPRDKYYYGGYDRWGFRPEEEGEDLDTALIRAARRQAYFQAQGGDRTLHLAGRPEREASAELTSLLVAKQGWARPPARGRVGGYGGGEGIDEETRRKLAGIGRARLPETGTQRAGFDPATMGGSAPLIRAREEAEAGREAEKAKYLVQSGDKAKDRESKEIIAMVMALAQNADPTAIANLMKGLRPQEEGQEGGTVNFTTPQALREEPPPFAQKFQSKGERSTEDFEGGLERKGEPYNPETLIEQFLRWWQSEERRRSPGGGVF